jgi:hypothetical protein
MIANMSATAASATSSVSSSGVWAMAIPRRRASAEVEPVEPRALAQNELQIGQRVERRPVDAVHAGGERDAETRAPPSPAIPLFPCCRRAGCARRRRPEDPVELRK